MTSWKNSLASLKPVRGWLLDVYSSNPGEVTVWIITEMGERVRLTDRFQPKVYVSGRMADLSKLTNQLATSESAVSWRYVEKYADFMEDKRTKVLEITATDCRRIPYFARKFLMLGGYQRFRLHNVDVPDAQTYFYDRDIFPLASVGVTVQGDRLAYWLLDSVESVDYRVPPLRLMRMRVEIVKEESVPSFNDSIGSIVLECDGESVKEVIATQESWGPSSKIMAVAAYTFFASMNGILWNPPKHKPKRTLPFIPLESEIDALISAAGKKLATTLQLVKETGMRIGEACKLKWVDVDLEHNTVTVNDPEKASNPRMLKISNKLAAMLNTLPKDSQRVFGDQSPRSVANNLRSLRKRLAIKLQNPRLNQIHFHTLRHFKATMEYHKTRNLLYVMETLGHRSIQSTTIYTHLITFESDEYHSDVAETIEEARALIEAGFEYVCTYEDTLVFRKRK